jgi:DNA-binding transcriptional LysR family regulator
VKRYFEGVSVFVAVAELGGFRAAARQLGVTPSAVSQAIRALEEAVGTPLFARTTRSVRLTDAGERLLSHARPSLNMLEAGIAAASDKSGEARGRLRIGAQSEALAMLAKQVIPDFFKRYPNVELELVCEGRPVDIAAEGFDAGLHFDSGPPSSMVDVRLMPVDRLVVAGAPGLFLHQAAPTRPSDLENWPCIVSGAGAPEPSRWRFTCKEKTISVAVNGPLLANDANIATDAAICGVGLIQLPRSLLQEHLTSGKLITVLDDYALTVPGLSLYHAIGADSSPKVRHFIRFALERFRQLSS